MVSGRAKLPLSSLIAMPILTFPWSIPRIFKSQVQFLSSGDKNYTLIHPSPTLQAEVQKKTLVSRGGDIKVNLDNEEPKSIKIDELKRRTWNLSLAHHSTILLKNEFVV